MAVLHLLVIRGLVARTTRALQREPHEPKAARSPAQELRRLALVSVRPPVVLRRFRHPPLWRHRPFQPVGAAAQARAGRLFLVALGLVLLTRLPMVKLVALGHKRPRHLCVAAVQIRLLLVACRVARLRV